MRIRLLISDISAVFLGTLGLYAILAATLLGAFHSSGLLMLLVMLFAMSMCFLLPTLQSKLVRLTFKSSARMPFLVISALWLQMTMGLFAKLKGLPVPLPGWTLLNENWVGIYLTAVCLLVFSYVFPGAAYDIMRSEQADLDEDGLDDPNLEIETADEAR